MKELFEALEKRSMDDVKPMNSVLLDTCFLVHVFERQHEKRLDKLTKSHNVFLTSFNVEEFDHIKHKIDESVRERARKYFKKQPNIGVIDLDVHPGNRVEEAIFVNDVDKDLLREIADPSDAVLIAAAILSHSKVITKDKHHLFTVNLGNYLTKYDITVVKDIHTLE